MFLQQKSNRIQLDLFFSKSIPLKSVVRSSSVLFSSFFLFSFFLFPGMTFNSWATGTCPLNTGWKFGNAAICMREQKQLPVQQQYHPGSYSIVFRPVAKYSVVPSNLQVHLCPWLVGIFPHSAAVALSCVTQTWVHKAGNPVPSDLCMRLPNPAAMSYCCRSYKAISTVK